MDVVNKIRESFADEWLPHIYEYKIRTQRTRSIRLDVPARENTAEIQYTLLGIELKVGKQRFTCPDLATARYMLVFARLGSSEFAVPYDITRISTAADQLETSWQRSVLGVSELTAGRSSRVRSQARAKLIAAMRNEIAAIGAGDPIPAFDRETRQRNQR